jgi:transposase
VRDREHETGVRSSFQIGGHRRSRLEEAESVLRRWITAEPGLTLEELRERLALQGIATKIGALWHQLNKWNLTFKKNAARQRARARGRAGGAARME